MASQQHVHSPVANERDMVPHVDHHARDLSTGSDSGRDEVKNAIHTLDATGLQPISEFKRFAILTACVFAMICASTTYAYNLFSGELQAEYSLNFRSVSTINTVGMVFCYFLMPYGILCDYFGPTLVYCIAATYFTLGALLFGLTFQGVITGSVVKLSVFNALFSLGAQLFDLVTMTVVLSIFPTRRGWVIAILKTTIGLAQAIFASIRTGFFLDINNSYYFYFLMALVLVCSAFIIPIVRLPAYHLTGYEEKKLSAEQKEKRMERRVVYFTQEPPMWRFYFGLVIIVILVVYLPVTSALLAFADMPADAARAFAIVAIVLTMCLLGLLVPFPYLDRLTTKKSKQQLAEEAAARELDVEGSDDSDGNANEPVDEGLALEAASDTPPPESSTPSSNNDAHSPGKKKAQLVARKAEVVTDIDYVAPQYQTTFLQSCCTLKLWALFWTMFVGIGTELVFVYNGRYIYAAMDKSVPDYTTVALLTVINSAGSGVGRLGMSVLEMLTQSRPAEKRIPITVSIFIPTSVIIVAVVLFLTLPGKGQLLAYALAAIGNGFCGAITVVVTRTLYAKDPAKHYNFVLNSMVPASVLINRLLFGEWYAVQADKRGEMVCLDKVCIMMPLLVMLGLNVTALFTNLYVHFHYIFFCRRVLEERRRIKEGNVPGRGNGGDAGSNEDEGGEEEMSSQVRLDVEDMMRKPDPEAVQDEPHASAAGERCFQEGHVEPQRQQ